MDATADSATCEANRKHVVEESVQALFAPRVPVQKTLATARPWPFDQPRNCAVFTTRQVLDCAKPILPVTHDADDHGWQFLSSEARAEDAKIIALEEAVELDPSVLDSQIYRLVGTLGVPRWKNPGFARLLLMRHEPSNQAIQPTADSAYAYISLLHERHL
jgi:hypothetical protein